ncbi:MAG: hypothetical protein M1434_14115 [Chloroflexi bacterium]|nr:hypothetical protein [Chloroflexota bacterium]MCL5275856.1 hypothetical protein [Chloroflexota bacterium]
MAEMQLFLDSGDALDRPSLLRGRMARYGYLFMRGLLPAAAVREIYDAILDICVRKGWTDLRAHPLGQARLEGSPEFFEVYDEVQRLELFHAFAHRPEVLQVIAILVQEPVFVHPRNIARISFPHAEFFTTPAHQDYLDSCDFTSDAI